MNSGSNCEVNIDDCASVTCDVINSECVDGVNSFQCRCIAGFYGTKN